MKDSLGYEIKEKRARKDYLDYRNNGWSHRMAMKKVEERYYAK